MKWERPPKPIEGNPKAAIVNVILVFELGNKW